MRRSLLLVATLALGAIALIAAAACGDDDNGGGASSEQIQQLSSQIADLTSQVEEMNRTGSVASVTGALAVLGATPYHDTNETIAGGSLEGVAGGPFRNAVAVLAGVAWPDGLRAGAADLQMKTHEFVNALADAETPEDMLALSLDAHDAYHDFEGLAWEWVAAQARVTFAGGEEDHGGDDDEMHDETSGDAEGAQ